MKINNNEETKIIHKKQHRVQFCHIKAEKNYSFQKSTILITASDSLTLSIYMI